MLAGEKRPLLVTRTREFPFVDSVHKGYWEDVGIRLCEENGVSLDFVKRSRPPLSVRLREALKTLVFAALPNTLIVRLQNALSIGAKERR